MRSALEGRHPADIAEVMEQMTRAEALAVFNWLDNARAAEALDEVDPDLVRYLLEHAPPGRIADLLDRLPMDDAAEVVSEAAPAQGEALLADLTARSPEDAAEVRKANHQNLANCDAVILFYGTGDEAWKRANRNELKKMAAYRGDRLPPAATYLAEPRTDDKQDMIDMEEEGLIDGRDGLTESALTKFLEQVAKAPTAA